MFLGKNLLAIPISSQYEQYCNAAALNKMGIQTLQKIDDSFVENARNWIKKEKRYQLPEIADTKKLVQFLINLAVTNKGEFNSKSFVENLLRDLEVFSL